MKNYIREVRIQKGYTQVALAEKTGVSRQSIHAIETGKYVPTTILALRLARVLGMPVEALFELETDD